MSRESAWWWACLALSIGCGVAFWITCPDRSAQNADFDDGFRSATLIMAAIYLIPKPVSR